MKYFILFSDKKHPRDLGPADVERWLTHLATRRRVSKATQALALNSVVYLYDKYLGMPLGDLGDFRRAERQRKLPVVLSQAEVARLLDQLRGTHRLMI